MLNKRVILESIKVKDRLNRKFSNITVEYFNSLPEKKKLYISAQYINEVNRLHNDILLREFIDAKSIANFFTSSSLGSGVGQSILEWALKNLLEKYLGIKDGFLLQTILNFLLDDPATLIKSFTDCNIFTEKLVDALAETLVLGKIQNAVFKDNKWSGMLGDVLRNTLAEFIQNNEMKKKLMQTLTPIVCKFISNVFSQLKNKFFG
jgi:hypothetical protein